MSRRKTKTERQDCDQCLEWQRQWPTRPTRIIYKATTWRQPAEGPLALCAPCARQFDQETEALANAHR